MALNLVYRNTDSKNRVRDLGKTLASGQPVIAAGRPANTVTGSADYTRTETQFGYTISGIPAGGIGLVGQEVTLAFDGTWEYPAADFDGTKPDPRTIAQDTDVNFVVASGKLTLAATSGNTVVPFGKIDLTKDYDRSRGLVPVQIGERA